MDNFPVSVFACFVSGMAKVSREFFIFLLEDIPL
jgi:hypothetical protein